jgi:hypothetical protein
MPCNCPQCKPHAGSNQRALDLLFSYLTERQQVDCNREGYFEMKGSDGHTYRIHTNTYSGNVVRMTPPGRRKSFCCYPNATHLPLADLILGQYLALTTDAARFVRTAY